MPTEELVPWDKISSLKKSNLDVIVDQIHDYQQKIDDAQASISKLKSKLLSALMAADVKTVGVGYLERDEKGKEEVKVARTTLVPEGETKNFDKGKAWKLLLKEGMESTTLERVWKKSTKVEPRSAYVKITWAKEEKEEEEG